MTRSGGFGRILAMALALGAASIAHAGDGEAWSVSKSSGEVWMTTTGAQTVSLSQQDVLKPGDTIRTGRNGRVLLVRGAETILVSPNSAVGLPTENKDGLSTTIVQQAGSMLLEVEKRNVKHFEVETPYLVAVVKGTQFRVSVNAASTSIEVIRGQVEVADFRSGQIAQVMPGQLATASAHGKPGLALSGSGTFAPIEHGRPRASTIQQLMVPKSGLSAPRHAASEQRIRALGHNAQPKAPSNSGARGNSATRISVSLGEVRLNFHKVTHGLAHGAISTPGMARNVADKDTVWVSREAGTTTSSAGGTGGSSNGGNSGSSNGSNNGSSNGSSSGNSSSATAVNVATGVTAGTISGVTGTVAGVTGLLNGNNGNNGANGNGNNGNGNGNGHGHAYGHFK
jgi:FecR-like protein